MKPMLFLKHVFLVLFWLLLEVNCRNCRNFDLISMLVGSAVFAVLIAVVAVGGCVEFVFHLKLCLNGFAVAD